MRCDVYEAVVTEVGRQEAIACRARAFQSVDLARREQLPDDLRLGAGTGQALQSRRIGRACSKMGEPRVILAVQRVCYQEHASAPCLLFTGVALEERADRRRHGDIAV